MLRPNAGRARRDPCAKCGLPVFIAERLNVGKQLYHRTCFRCARCNSQLTLANYYETETENQFCCETCPDEEQSKQIEKDNSDLNEKLLSRSLSDEEKSAGIQKFEDPDDYSCMFETALEDPDDQMLSKNYTLSSEQSAEFTKARSRFITSQLADSEDDSEDEAPDLPKSEPPSLPQSEPPALPKSEPPDLEEFILKKELDFVEDSENTTNVDKSKDVGEKLSSIVSSEQCESRDSGKLSSIVSSEQCESRDSGFPSNTQSLDSLVHSSIKVSDVSDKSQPETAFIKLDTNKIVTKENKFQNDNGENVSLVKTRMRMFENKFTSDQSKEQFGNFSVKDISKSAEKKFIPKVPSEEEQSSTGLGNKDIEIIEVDSDNSINSSAVDAVDSENIENHTELKSEKQIQENVEKSEDSVIVISDSSKDEISTVISSSVTDKSSVLTDDDANEKDSQNDKNADAHKSNQSNDVPSVIEIPDSVTSEEVSSIKQEKEEQYPEDLNPFGDDNEDEEKPKSDKKVMQPSLNPFGEDEDEPEERKPSPKPAVRKKIKVRQNDLLIAGTNSGTPEHLAEIKIQRLSYNPFDDDDDEENKKETKPFMSHAHTMKLMPAPRISLNPFWSDGEEPDEEENGAKQKPVPLPRNSRSSIGTPEPKPRKSGLSVSSGLSSTIFGSNTSLSSAHSSVGPSARKKKQAPRPPTVTDKQDSAQSSVTSSPSPSVQHSPKLTPRVRKSKKAPLPPSTTSTPFMAAKDSGPVSSEISPIIANNEEPSESPESPMKAVIASDTSEWEKEKIMKDELNRNRQSQAITSPISSSENSASLPTPNKSTYGKWKRRKGPAPSRPIPQRRNIKPLPVVEIKRELEFIEIQQQGLEKQGVRLEQIIREKCEGPNADLDSSLAPEVEDLILQLFELVNEKNELFRKQAELMYLRRQQRLEEEYADLEYQIRCLMIQPEANKTDTDKAREEELINRLVEVVERRNEIVECLEMDRVREAEEDDSINNQLNLYVSKREEDSSGKSNPEESKQKKKSKKEKKFKFKTAKKVDVDKDIDECESSSASSPVKDKKKKKFNLF